MVHVPASDRNRPRGGGPEDLSPSRSIDDALRGAVSPSAAVRLPASFASWPEFAAAGKGAITGRHVIAHPAGLPVSDALLTSDQVL